MFLLYTEFLYQKNSKANLSSALLRSLFFYFYWLNCWKPHQGRPIVSWLIGTSWFSGRAFFYVASLPIAVIGRSATRCVSRRNQAWAMNSWLHFSLTFAQSDDDTQSMTSEWFNVAKNMAEWTAVVKLIHHMWKNS